MAAAGSARAAAWAALGAPDAAAGGAEPLTGALSWPGDAAMEACTHQHHDRHRHDEGGGCKGIGAEDFSSVNICMGWIFMIIAGNHSAEQTCIVWRGHRWCIRVCVCVCVYACVGGAAAAAVLLTCVCVLLLFMPSASLASDGLP